MTVAKDKVVLFHYSLLNSKGDLLENSDAADPMAVLIGCGNILIGLEDAMLGKSVDDQFSVTLPPEQAYGLTLPNAQKRIPIKHLVNAKKKMKLTAGDQIKVNTDQGVRDATVIKVGKFNVDIDTNHPLAGQTLTFDITIDGIRDASDDELSHGHAHGDGGHHH